MLGQFCLHPMLKGWEYKTHVIERTMVRGATPHEKRIRERGWILGIAGITTDCYATFRVSWQGADLQTRELVFNAEAGLVLGATVQDPAGWLRRYYRPNPASSEGIFVGIVFSGGLQGAALPFIPTVVMEISLPTESTQESAYISGVAEMITVTNPKLFLETLRSIQGIKGKIDPGLLTFGASLEAKP